ncbi:glycosyltransferase family 2 protein [Caldichromatium japonicum]|uniref:Glycosyltransferase family 2 protein n=1 Tax=Caldichromatium japonicum TaxID=2699430 RepID=A0A6G7VAL8_9GAMM|nr:glycosyltransferase family 2 protein [Caldichromatium japonicum]QIK36950.1 glycosyltransferase family 2 protein [Caldichromatium japonicum]
MISVIVPTRNRAHLLSRALQSIAAQTLAREHFEVIVVDNGSTDETARVVADHALRLSNLRSVRELRPGLHAGRHRGLREARGDLLVFVDDDIEAVPGWLAAIVEAFADPEVVMVGGNNLPRFEQTPPGWLLRLWERPVYGGQAIPWLSILRLPDGIRLIAPTYVWGCNFAIRRQTLLDAGGFHPDAMPRELIRFRGDGETHVSRQVAALGLKCLFHSGATVFHFVSAARMTFGYFRQRAFDQGISDSFADLRLGRRTAWLGLRSFALFASRWLRSSLEMNPELRELRRCMAVGYREGYDFHQRAYREDIEVRNWVMKTNFF